MSQSESHEFQFGQELAKRLESTAWQSQEGLLVLEAIGRASVDSGTATATEHDTYLLAKSNLERLYEMFRARYRKIGREVDQLDFTPLVNAGLLAEKPDRRDIDGIKEKARKYFLAGDLLAFCTLAQHVVELLSADLLEGELVVSAHRNKRKTRRVLETELTQPVREELLYRCGIIGSDTRDALQHGREFSDTVARDLRERRTVHTIDGAIDEIERYLAVLNQLYERKTGQELIEIDSLG